MVLEDGAGTGTKAQVNAEKQLSVAAVTQKELEHESEENGTAFNWCSDTVNLTANDTILLVKNDSDTALHIECIKINNGSVESEYTLHLPTTEVTPTGTAVTGTNINTGSSNVAEATSKSNESNNSQGNVLESVFLAVNANIGLETPGLILGKNKSVAVDVVADTSESSVTIIGHFSD